MTDRIILADASKISPADFLRLIQGKPPLTDADRAEQRRAADEFWKRRREENRRELEELRNRFCSLVSPELQAKWRAKWTREDARIDLREDGGSVAA